MRQLARACLASRRNFGAARSRAGLTLTELLVASTIMVMIVGAMSMLAMTVHSANDHCQGQALAAQHGRVVLDHISKTVSGAAASEDFPGFVVVTEQIGSWKFPDTLAIWLPEGVAADPHGLPRISEIVLLTPDPADASRLLRLRLPGDSSVVPAAGDAAAWRSLAASLRADPAAERVTLTDRLRTGAVIEGSDTNVRACLRFALLLAPDDAQWTDYRDGILAWEEIDWPLDAYSSVTGTRRVVCQIELQVVTDDAAASAATSVPFFGSAGMTYNLSR